MENRSDNNEQSALAFPIGLRYNLSIQEGVAGSRNLARFSAENPSVFQGTQNNVVRIPVSSPGFLDLKNAVLGFDLKNTSAGGTTVVTLDGGANAIIQRYRVLSSNGNEIERIDSYNQLACVLDQYSSNLSGLVSDSAMNGTPKRLSYTTKTPEVKADQTTKAVTMADGTTITVGTLTALELTVSNPSGGKGYMQEECDDLDTGITRHYESGLKGGFFNPSSAKMLPGNVSFILELTLAPPNNCLKTAATTAGFEARNFILSIPTVQIMDTNAMSRLNMRLSKGVAFQANTFHHHVNTVGSVGPSSIQIGERSRVLKGLMSIFRYQADISDKTKFKISKRTIQPVNNYQYQIGSSQYPSNQINIVCDKANSGANAQTPAGTRLGLSSTADMNISEAYSEVLRVFGGLNSNVSTTVIGQEPFAQSTLNNGCGLIAIDLQAYSDGSVTSGIDTASNSLPVVLNTNLNGALTATMQVDTYSISQLTIIVDEFGNLFSES